MIRVDMSEFMEKHSVARLIGAPPGYVGYEEGGYLTEAVRRKPYSLILLDEVEKAHNDVFNILLQVLDDGRLTDGHGRTVEFSNCVLVMTSNLGSEAIQTFTQDGADNDNVEAFNQRLNDMVMGIVAQHFRPEFINRVDDVVVFKPLSSDHIQRIAQLQLGLLNQRLRAGTESDAQRPSNAGRVRGRLRSGLRSPSTKTRTATVGGKPSGAGAVG